MVKLTAKRPVLYQGRMYAPGDALPAYDTRMVEAWLEAGTAEMTGAEETPTKPAGGGLGGPEEPRGAQGGQDHHTQNESGAEGGTEPPKAPEQLEGHLDPKQLASMKKADLEDLAEKLGVDISGAKNNQERAELIAAAPVQAPVNENGGAQ